MSTAIRPPRKPPPVLPGPTDRTWLNPASGPELDPDDPEVLADAAAERGAIQAVERDEPGRRRVER